MDGGARLAGLPSPAGAGGVVGSHPDGEVASRDRPRSAGGRAVRSGTTAPASLPPSTYLDYLPAPYQGDEFMGRFLLIFESILGPIERMIDQLAYYFDPALTPVELLPWLASWVGVELDERWPEAAQRALVAAAAGLFRWRGTRRALREHLQLYTQSRPLIVENCDGLRLGPDAALGVNTRLGRPREGHIFVTVPVAEPSAVAEPVVRSLIEAELPAHVQYTLRLHVVQEVQEVQGSEEG